MRYHSLFVKIFVTLPLRISQFVNLGNSEGTFSNILGDNSDDGSATQSAEWIVKDPQTDTGKQVDFADFAPFTSFVIFGATNTGQTVGIGGFLFVQRYRGWERESRYCPCTVSAPQGD